MMFYIITGILNWSNNGKGQFGPWTFFISLFIILPQTVTSVHNEIYEVQKLCQSLFMTGGIYINIDGALISSKSERNLDCVMTFQTPSVIQRFMVRFDYINIDCNDHLYIYDGGNAVGAPRANLSCKTSIDDFDVMYTRTNFVTMRFTTDAWGAGYGFRLLITAFTDHADQPCTEFTCRFKNLCISKDLVCDSLTHCLDGSDEPPSCQTRGFAILRMNKTMMTLAMAGSGLILCVLLITCVGYFICRKKQPTTRHSEFTLNLPSIHTNNSISNLQLDNIPGVNGTRTSSKCLMSKAYSQPGNFNHPAVLKLGYSEVRHRPYCREK